MSNGPGPGPYRVLLVANYESDVGYAWWLMENFWREIAVAADQRGLRCLLVYPQLRGVPAAVAGAPIDVTEFRFAFRTTRDVWAGLRLIRRCGVRSIYLTDWPYLHWVYALWRLSGVRRIVVHDHTPGDRPSLSGWRALAKRTLHALRFLSATAYVAVSPYIGTRLRENACVPARRCLVVTNGIEPFACAPDRRTTVRAGLGIPDAAVLVVMVSRATVYKGLDFAVRCLAEVSRALPEGRPMFAVHCGDGPDRAALEAQAAREGVADRVRFLGRRADVRDILCAADIAFHPSRGEAMSLSVLEFMCAGLAILTSDLPSVRTAIEPGVTGLTYRAEDLQSAAAQLRALVEDASVRATLGAAARAACVDRYTLAATNATFRRVALPAILPGAAGTTP